MKTRIRDTRNSSALFVTMVTLASLSLMVAYELRRVVPKFQEAYQTAAWQEARVAAEAGVDAAIGDLVRNATGGSAGTWDGWKQNQNGIIGPVLSSTVNQLLSGVLSLLGGSVTVSPMSEPIFLDNISVAAASGIPTAVDVQLWAVPPVANTRSVYFRIRSMATCGLPPAAYRPPESLDRPLRRLSLRNVRPQLRKDDVGEPMSIPTPSASRIVEVLVEPIQPFELAIWTQQSLKLGTGGTWSVDSYDSRDPDKSNPDGTYPGKTSPKVQGNANVACNLGRPGNSLYGPLISANGTRVRGIVATNGGDNPETGEHENVLGAVALDPARIRSDFCREMNPVTRPAASLLQLPPLLGLPFVAGTESAPSRYLIAGNLGAFSVVGPAGGVKGMVVLMVNGNLDVLHGDISIPPNVTVQIFVRGHIDFHSSSVNVGPASSNRPAQLQIYGEDSAGAVRTLRVGDGASICAAFYGPGYDVRLTGNTEWSGSIGARSFEMSGAGGGGFHYDEALALVGPPISFRIARYIEDVRE